MEPNRVDYSIFLLLDGHAKMYDEYESYKGKLGPGDYVGESEILLNIIDLKYTVTCSTICTVGVLSPEHMNVLI